jgi:ATP-dependent Zn protease
MGGSGNGIDAQILNAFLSEMDGFIYDEKRPVLIVAATNYSISEDGTGRLLDPAFVRRFDRKIKIDLPNTAERAEFIRYYLKKHEINTISDGTIETLALRSYACSPADLEMIVELAIRNAKGKDLTDELLTEAFDMERFGEANQVSKDSLLQTTYHEAGHTLVAYLCGEKPTFVTNISRSNFGGYMLHEIDDLRSTLTRQDLLDRICCALAGRCAELIVFGTEKGLTTGASGDLNTANELALQIVNGYAMTEGLVTMDVKIYGNAVGQLLFEKVERILAGQYDRAMRLIEANRDKLERLTEELLRKNSLTKDEIIAVLG